MKIQFNPAIQVALAALPLAACLAGLTLLGEGLPQLEIALGLLGGAFLALFWASKRIDHCLLALGSPRRQASHVLGLAFVLRLAVLPLAPAWSDDVYRYLWDGRVVAAGFNPYRLPPEAPELIPLRDELWLRLPHRSVPTVYPPLALAAFSATSQLPRPLLCWKLLLLVADLMGCAYLCAIAVQRGTKWSRVIAYTWNPLLVIEGVGMGHVDVLGVSAALAAVWALGKGAPVRAGLAAAAGIATKLGPLIVLPAWGRGSSGPARFWITALLTSAAFLLPVLWSVGGIPQGLTTYAVSWEYNGPIFEPLWRFFDQVELGPRLASLLDHLKTLTEHRLDDALNVFYPRLYPQFLAKLLLALAFFALMLHSLRRADPVTASRRVFGAALLCSATVYPWYLLWVLPWAALEGHRGWLAAATLSSLAYLPQHREWNLFPWLWLLLWLPAALLEGRHYLRRQFAHG